MSTTAKTQAHAVPRVAMIAALAVAMLVVGPIATQAQAAESGAYDVEFADDRPVEGEHTHDVESGEYLSTIADEYNLGDDGWQALFDANESVENPDLIHVGQEITIPEEGETLEARPLPDGEPAVASSSGDEQSSESSEQSSESNESESEQTSEPSQSESEQSSEPSATQASTSVSNSTWDALAECESGGNWQTDTGNSFYGGLQFNKSSWDWAGGDQYAEYPHEASRGQQIATAERLLEIHPAGWGAWPACSSELGLR